MFEDCIDLTSAQVTDDIVEEVVKHMAGGAGPSGIDSSSLRQWLLKYGGAITKLCKTLASLVESLARLTWRRLTGLDKCHMIRSACTGDMLRHFLCKVLLKVAGKEAARACKTDKLCGSLEEGIEGATHHMRSSWETHEDDEDVMGVSLIDVRITFNEGNREIMVHIARHEWPSGFRF